MDLGHKHERQDLDQKIKQLHQQRTMASRDIPSLEQRIEQRGSNLAAERRWAAEHVGLGARERELRLTLSVDAGARGHEATRDRPSYLTHSLGPVPDDPSRRIQWERVAGSIEQHRTIHNITDPDRALGPRLEWSDVSDRALEQQQLERQAQHVQHAAPGHDLAPRQGPVLEL